MIPPWDGSLTCEPHDRQYREYDGTAVLQVGQSRAGIYGVHL
jgi:hypothetical protein